MDVKIVLFCLQDTWFGEDSDTSLLQTRVVSHLARSDTSNIT